MKRSRLDLSTPPTTVSGVLFLSLISIITPTVAGFSTQLRWRKGNVSSRFALTHSNLPTNNNVVESGVWMKRGLLISSFHDGILNNPPAQEFLIDSVTQAIWSERQQRVEQAVRDSVLQSPCCGPNMAAFEALEDLDQAQRMGQQLPPHSKLRIVYIPTAMYAVRSDSQSTPGKQRQRARADAKQRRNTIVQFLQESFGERVGIAAVTLDLDDGSIKHLEGSDSFPKSGMEALQEWSPHLIYIEGGNTFWLHYCMSKGGWDSLLMQACQHAVYVGKSAGAILAGYLVETACWKGWDDPSIVPGMSEYAMWRGVRGLGLMGNTCVFPHMAPEWEERVATLGTELLQNKQAAVVCCLTDEQAGCVDGVAKRIQVVSATTTTNTSTTVLEGFLEGSLRNLAGSSTMD